MVHSICFSSVKGFMVGKWFTSGIDCMESTKLSKDTSQIANFTATQQRQRTAVWMPMFYKYSNCNTILFITETVTNTEFSLPDRERALENANFSNSAWSCSISLFRRKLPWWSLEFPLTQTKRKSHPINTSCFYKTCNQLKSFKMHILWYILSNLIVYLFIFPVDQSHLIGLDLMLF